MYSRLGYQIKMIDNNWLDDVDSLAGNSSSLALSVIKSKSHPKLIPSFSGHDSLSKIISNIYHWMTQGISSWPGRIFLHTLSHPWLSVLALVIWKCVGLLGLLETRHWHRNVRRKRCLTKICSLKEHFLYKLKWGMFPIIALASNFLSKSAVLTILIVLSERESGFIFV